MKRLKSGERASLPLRKHHLVPVTWRKDSFTLTASSPGHRSRVTLNTARGTKSLTLSISRDHPYDPERVRAVRLLDDAGELFLDITAWVKVTPATVDPKKVAGIDPGIIHPLVVATGDKALVISGRALRAEEFLHLEDQKLRDEHLAKHRKPVRAYPGKPRQEGSRRWRKINALRRAADAKSRRRVHQAANRAARLAVDFAEHHGAGSIVIGNPIGIEKKDSGRIQNRRVSRWPRARTRNVVQFRAEERGIAFEAVDERGTRSRCPSCDSPATKSGRKLSCTDKTCKRQHHRDVAGAQNIAKAHGGAVTDLAHIEHRRVGTPSRRDRRRLHHDGLPEVKARTRAAKESLAAA
jgi:transposase